MQSGLNHSGSKQIATYVKPLAAVGFTCDEEKTKLHITFMKKLIKMLR